MKRTLLVPVVLLLNTLLFGVLIGIPVILVHSETAAVLHYLGPIMLVATVAAVLFTVVRSVFREIVPPLFLFLIALTVVGIISGVLVFDETVLSQRRGDPAVRNHYRRTRFFTDPSIPYVSEMRPGAALKDVLLFRHDSVPTIKPFATAVWNEQTMEIVVLGEEGSGFPRRN